MTRRAGAWAKKTGATVSFAPPGTPNADIVVIRPTELGAWVAKNDTRKLPDELRDANNPLQWSRYLIVETERLASWAGEAQSIPLAGEAYLIAYRADRLADPKAGQDYSAKFGRPLAPPATWEEFADIAEFFADRGQPSLPSLAEDPERVLREFHFVAACYDRQAIAGTTFTAQMKDGASRDTPISKMLAFHHDIETGQSRLLKPAFVETAKWLPRVARCRMKADGAGKADPIAALVSGPAVMAVVSLRELGRLPKDGGAAPPTIGVAALPGTKVSFDGKDGQPRSAGDNGKGANFIPYFGAEGWLGIVRNSCPDPAAAFDLLSELSRLERSAELLSDPTLGFGPFRAEHLDQAHESIWQRYGFDEKRSRQLADAVRRSVDVGLANPVIAARGPDQADQMAILARELAPVAAGTRSPEEALAAADAAWRKADSTRPPEALKAERRQSAGLR
nr:extracellular solute-binding protein [Limnoglobus roseus]